MLIVQQFLALCLSLFLILPASAAERPDSFSDLAERLLPTVVNISSSQTFEQDNVMPELPEFPEGSPFEKFFEDFMGKRQQRLPSKPPASMGSGFVIDAKNGYIVTNNHVIRSAEEVRVTFHDDESLLAEVIATDEKTDIAVLKVDPKGYDLVETSFGDSDVMRVGDWVVAIGNPFGLGGTVTAGIISARARDINAGPYDDFIQTDASINRGNSGGPMFNTKGEVIGINTAIFSPTGGSVGIGFAIPANLAQPVIDQLIKYGRTRRGWLGVRIQQVTDEIADSLGLGDTMGALVSSVTEDGPAAQAGLQSGDIILDFDGKKIDEIKSLPRLVAETDIGKEVRLSIWRDEKKKELSVVLGELERAEEDGLLETDGGAPATKGDLVLEDEGIELSNLTDSLRERFSISQDLSGVVITNVKRGTDASVKGLEAGDVIVEINQKSVNSTEALSEILDDVKDTGRRSALLLVNRTGDIRFVALKLGA